MAVKINEALYEMKEKLLSVEEQFLKITEEKSRMETVLKEKVEMIRVCWLALLACLVSLAFL